MLCPLWSSYLEKEIYLIYVVDSSNLGQVSQVGVTLPSVIGKYTLRTHTTLDVYCFFKFYKYLGLFYFLFFFSHRVMLWKLIPKTLILKEKDLTRICFCLFYILDPIPLPSKKLEFDLKDLSHFFDNFIGWFPRCHRQWLREPS